MSHHLTFCDSVYQHWMKKKNFISSNSLIIWTEHEHVNIVSTVSELWTRRIYIIVFPYVRVRFFAYLEFLSSGYIRIFWWNNVLLTKIFSRKIFFSSSKRQNWLEPNYTRHWMFVMIPFMYMVMFVVTNAHSHTVTVRKNDSVKPYQFPL